MVAIAYVQPFQILMGNQGWEVLTLPLKVWSGGQQHVSPGNWLEMQFQALALTCWIKSAF